MWVVVYTPSGVHHQQRRTPQVSSGVHPKSKAVFSCAASLTMQKILRRSKENPIRDSVEYFEFIYAEANAQISFIWLIIHFQQGVH